MARAHMNNTVNQIDLINIDRTIYPTASEYTFFSNEHGIFSRTDHMLGQKIIINKFKRLKSYQVNISIHNGMKLESKQEENWKIYRYIKLNNSLLSNQRIQREIKK